MPIKIPDDLPAIETLRMESIFVISEHKAVQQDIRPLRIIILNLMPTKIETETQLLRLIGNTPIQIDVTLLQMRSHESKNMSKEYLDRFYLTFDDIKKEKYDGLIITGAPVENLEFEEVDYWNELCEIMDWSKRNVSSTLHICWGAQAGLYHHYGVRKRLLDKKVSGIFKHKASSDNDPLLIGFDDLFLMPHSRYTEVRQEDLRPCPHLHVLATSDEVGNGIIISEKHGQVFIIGHCEYDAKTLSYEYERDLERGLNPDVPTNYFPNDDPRNEPAMNWRGHAMLLFTNWINHYVYQRTPYDSELIGEEDIDPI